jgi:predicted GNAT superfamily acetyltransferase
MPAGRVVLAEIPRAVNTLQDRPEVIVAWQRGLRCALEHYLARGYIVDDFVFGDRCFYVLKRGRAAE